MSEGLYGECGCGRSLMSPAEFASGKCVACQGPIDLLTYSGDAPMTTTPRPLHLRWNGTEWTDDRCGCRYHPDDPNMTHGGAPHVHRCDRHTAGDGGEMRLTDPRHCYSCKVDFEAELEDVLNPLEQHLLATLRIVNVACTDSRVASLVEKAIEAGRLYGLVGARDVP